MKESSLHKLIDDIHSNCISSWSDIHRFYQSEAESYSRDKLYHALDVLNSVHGISIKSADPACFKKLLLQSSTTAGWITRGILDSREKDYHNPFRRMVYDSQAEMDKVIGKPDENNFIKSQFLAFENYKSAIDSLISKWNL